MNIYKALQLVISIAILIALIFAFKVGLEEKHYYEECSIKILCENNKLNRDYDFICKQYRNATLVPNFTLVS